MTKQFKQPSLTFWFAMLVLIGPIHMTEQLFCGLDQLQELKGIAAAYYARFENPDLGTWWLVVIAFTLVQSLLLATITGGRWRLAAAGFLGASAVGEGHHLIQSVASGKYFPGLVTSIPFAMIGVMVVAAAYREWPRRPLTVEERVAAALA